MKHTQAYSLTLFALALMASCKSNESTDVQSTSLRLSANQIVHFGLSADTTTLDPRKIHGLGNINLISQLFEGLTRVDAEGKVIPGMAKTINVSPDMKIYTFILRESKWSNGDPVKASDFEYSWKSQLNPELNATYSYLFFGIQGAKAFFDGTGSQDDIGIRATDDTTLIVKLDHPTPYFLQLVAQPAFFPVNQAWSQAHPEWQDQCVSNGPFSLSSFKPQAAVELIKNNQYWAANQIRVDKAIISCMDDSSVFSRFEQGGLDWAGAPFSILPQQSLANAKKEGMLQSAPAAATYFLRVNVEKTPFNTAKMRRAFAIAINSQAICEHVMQGNQKPATAFVPPGLGFTSKDYYVSHDVQQARTLFEEALSDLKLTREQLPVIDLTYIDSERAQKMAEAVQQSWKETFNIDCTLRPLPFQSFYDAIFAKDYGVATSSWFADYYDPMSFLSMFQYKENATNNTQWANSEYTHLLEESCTEMDQQKRMALLQQAQDILMNDMPIMPVFYFSFDYVRSEELQGTALSPLGVLDIEDAYVVKPLSDQAP